MQGHQGCFGFWAPSPSVRNDQGDSHQKDLGEISILRCRLKFVGRSCTEKLAPIYRTTRRHVAQDRNFLMYRSGNLESQEHEIFSIFTTYFKIPFNIILPSTSRCNKCFVPFKFSEVLLYPLVAFSTLFFSLLLPPLRFSLSPSRLLLFSAVPYCSLPFS
jgi:hypothetical protein